MHQFKHLRDTKDAPQLTIAMHGNGSLQAPYVDSIEAQNVDPESILKYPLQTTDGLFTINCFSKLEVKVLQAAPAVRKM